MTLDRDAARGVLLDHALGSDLNVVLDALEGCVRPAPAQTIDRDAVVAELNWSRFMSLPDQADRILALLQPVDGVTFTRDEAAEITFALDTGGGIHYSIYKKLTAE